MYTKRIYSPGIMVEWTLQETLLFLAISAFPVVLYDLLDLKWVRIPWLPISLVGTAVAFILGFQNNAAYGRIWEARKIWGGIVNTSRTWGIMVDDFISTLFVNDRAMSESELYAIKKDLIYRHIAWMAALRHAMRAHKNWESFLKNRSNVKWAKAMQIKEHTISLNDELDELLTTAEIQKLSKKTNKATQLIKTQSRKLKVLREKDLIDDFRHVEMENVLQTLYDLQGKSERIKNFPYPRQYATLNMMFVWIFIFLLPFGLVFEFDNIGEKLQLSYPMVSQYFVWLSVPLGAVVMWVFHTMMRIGMTGENPFEGTANDVPITTIAKGIEIDLREMLEEDKDTIPKPELERHHVQT